MGSQAMILLVGTLAVVALFVSGLTKAGNDMVDNSSLAYGENMAKEINTAAMDIAMRTLADSTTWRAPLSNLQLSGGSATVTFKDTLLGADTAVVVRSIVTFISGIDTSYAATQAIVKSPADGFVPPVVHGTMTSFGPIDDIISDMTIDGRNWKDPTTLSPQAGIFAVSTSEATYINTQNAPLGATTYTTNPATDIAPTFPEDPLVVETNATWPNGPPSTPDAALGYPEGTLKNIAINKLIPGSQYVTKYADLVFPLRGVTYIEVANGTWWRKGNVDGVTLDPTGKPMEPRIGPKPEGILVFHSPATDALWETMQAKPVKDPFKGLIIADKMFHVHLDILGGIVMLSPNTVQGRTCNGNNGHWMKFSSEILEKVTQASTHTSDASWKTRVKVLSWYE